MLTICQGSNTTLTDSVNGGFWTSSAPGIATVDTSGIVTGVTDGTAIISYGVPNTCGIGYVIKTITINPMPFAGSIYGTSTLCAGDTATFTNSTPSGIWTSSAPSIAGINPTTGLITAIAAGNSTISYSVSNSCGIAYATRSVSVNPSPISTISGPSSVCVGGTYLYTASVPGGTWGATNTLGAISTLGSFTPSTPGVDTLLYTLTNSCGTGSSSYVVSIISLPTAGVIVGPTDICLGSTAMLYSSMPGGSWLSTNNAVATIGATGMVSGISLGTDTIKYTYTNMCGSASTYKLTPNPNRVR